MKNTIRFLCFILAVITVLCPVIVSAEGSENYIYNEYAEAVKAPAGYVCDCVIYGDDIGVGNLSNPSDLFVDEYIYVADTGNNRVLVLNKDYSLKDEISSVISDGAEQPLSSPSGVFYSGELLYICDTGNFRAIAIDSSRNVKRIFTMPDTELLADDFEFKPSKITVNSADTVFLVVEGVYQGLLQYSFNDEFIGFFGADKVEVTASVVIQNMWKNIFSDEQRESLVRTIPTVYTNVYIDSEDMIYTATATAETEQIKRLNSAGNNILVYPGSSGSLIQKGFDRSNFGDQHYSYVKGNVLKSSIVDVNVDESGIIAVLDSQRGRVFLYDNEQNQLCIFGGTGSQAGLFRKASAMDRIGTDYIIADSQNCTLTVFKQTDYMNNIRCALNEYNAGEYTAAAEYWQKVLDKCAALPVAYKGIGRALLLDGKSEEAMEYLKTGDDRYYYSMAVQQYRREYIRDNFAWLLPVVIAAVAAFIFLIKFTKKKIIESAKKGGRRA